MKILTVATMLIAGTLALSAASLAQRRSDGREAAPPAATQDVTQATRLGVKPEPALPDLPGLTTPDRTPNACVDCHANHPEMKRDFRLTTTLASWRDKADSTIVAKARATAPQPEKILGRHPDIEAFVKTIPDGCLPCHNRESRLAPPLGKLLHEIHLVGGKENHFLTVTNGTCTSCHKLDQKTGEWHLGSGEEK
jgi:hypothetical protein